MASGGFSDIDRGVDDFIEFSCSACKQKNINSEAEKICTDCDEYFCQACAKYHDGTHTIWDKEYFVSERCERHHNSVYMYCKNHDTVGCSKCMATDHSACLVVLVPEIIKTLTGVENSKPVKEKLKAVTSNMQNLICIFQQEMRRLLSNKNYELEKIHELRTHIINRIDDLERETLKDLERKFESLIEKVENGLKTLEDTIKEVNLRHDSLEPVEGSMSQIFVSTKKAIEVASTAETIINLKQEEAVSSAVEFTANQQLISLLNEMSSLGENVQRELLPPLLQVKEHNTIQLQLPSGYPCIIGACALPDGTIVLADSMNNELKRLSGFTLTVLGCCDIHDRPRYLCTISNQELAVCCPDARKVQLITVGNIMQKTSEICTHFRCEHVAYGDNKLFVSDGESVVYVLTMTGDIIQQLNPDFYRRGVLSFFNITGLSDLVISSDYSKIYVTYTYGLFIMDRNGKKIEKYSDSSLRAMCLHKNGNVLICNKDSSKILQMSAEGKVIGKFGKTGKQCFAMCCTQNKSRLIICHGNDEIDVIDISY